MMKFNYCMECAAPLSKQDETDFICPAGHAYWNNPKATASVIFLRDNQVLLARRNIEPFKDWLVIPGGFINFGENAYDAAKREMKEETNVDIGTLHLLDVFSGIYGETGISTCDVYFVVTDWKGDLSADSENSALVWKPIDFLGRTDAYAWPEASLVAKLHAFLDNR